MSTFGSKFMAIKHCCEYLNGLRYKLRMMGVPVNNPYYGTHLCQNWCWGKSQMQLLTTSVHGIHGNGYEPIRFDDKGSPFRGE